MTRPNLLTKFRELVDALTAEGALKQSETVEALSRLAASLTDENDRDFYHGELGISLGHTGDFAGAARLIEAVRSPHERAHYWRRLAEEEFKTGSRDALSLLLRSEESIDSLPADCYWERAEIISLNAKLLQDSKLGERASEAWSKAIRIAQKGQAAEPNGSDCSAVLVNIVGMLATVGHTELARSVADSITIPGRRKFAQELIEKASSQG
jgi:hypothetical protein